MSEGMSQASGRSCEGKSEEKVGNNKGFTQKIEHTGFARYEEIRDRGGEREEVLEVPECAKCAMNVGNAYVVGMSCTVMDKRRVWELLNNCDKTVVVMLARVLPSLQLTRSHCSEAGRVALCLLRKTSPLSLASLSVRGRVRGRSI